MSGLTPDAAREVARMLELGWDVRFAAGRCQAAHWQLTKVASERAGRLCHGRDADLFRAIQKALADERGTR
jgi:hypothetical protein